MADKQNAQVHTSFPPPSLLPKPLAPAGAPVLKDSDKPHQTSPQLLKCSHTVIAQHENTILYKTKLGRYKYSQNQK